MDLATRRAKDAAIRTGIAQASSSQDLARLVADLHSRFYSPRMTYNDIWVTLWRKVYDAFGRSIAHEAGCLIDSMDLERKARLRHARQDRARQPEDSLTG